MKPNKERIQKWVDSLRSGKYSQTTQTLQDSTGYCCLGVACELSGIGDWDEDLNYDIEGVKESECLPKHVADWYGIEQDALVEIERIEGSPFSQDLEYITLLNDDYKMSFTEIARCIERTYLWEKEDETE